MANLHRLPTDRMPNSERLPRIAEPDVVIAVDLTVEQWAAVLASAAAAHSASDVVAVDTVKSHRAATRLHSVDPRLAPRAQLAEELPAETDTYGDAEILVTDTEMPVGRHRVRLHARGGSAILVMDAGYFSDDVRARFAKHVDMLASATGPLNTCELPVITHPRPIRAVPGADAMRAQPSWQSCVISRLLEVAACSPEVTALVAADRSLTYTDLCSWVGGIAEQLRIHNPERIGVLVDYEPESVIAVLAALAAGAVYIPLDSGLPDGRLRRILRQASPDLVLHSARLSERARRLAPEATTIQVERCSADLTPPPTNHSTAPGSHAAYVLYTSGTTGKPKGVCQTVAGLLGHARTYRDSIALDAGETIPVLASLAFDAAMMDLYGGLLGGATVHLVNPFQTGADLRSAIGSVPPDVLHATPTLLRHILVDSRGTWKGSQRVRVVVFGGERVIADDLQLVRDRLPQADVINGLGPSECTTALQYVMRSTDAIETVIAIGNPVPGVDVSLHSSGGSNATISGELVITSSTVATGYLDQPELTEARFQRNSDGTRSYRTGDLAWVRPDGSFAFTGRLDRQVKVRGQRVEPQEVELVLQAHPTIAQAAVIIADDKRLVAYVTSATNFRPVPADVIRYAARQLPSSAVPAQVVAIDQMPVGPTGKRNLAALADLDGYAEPPVAQPLSLAQQRIAAIWRRLLRHGHFGINDDFLFVGGDSLLMTNLWSDLEAEFQVALDFAEVVAGCTITDLSNLCESTKTRQVIA